MLFRSVKILVYGVDFTDFSEISDYITLKKAIPFHTHPNLSSKHIKRKFGVTDIVIDIPQEGDYTYDSSEIEGLGEPLTYTDDSSRLKEQQNLIKKHLEKLELERIERERVAKEQQALEEQARVAAEEEEKQLQIRIKQEELERVQKEHEIERLAVEEQLKQAALKADHEATLNAAKLKASEEILAREQVAAELEVKQKLIDARAEAIRAGRLSGDIDIVSLLSNDLMTTRFIAPVIPPEYSAQKTQRRSLIIGKANNTPRADIFIVASAVKDSGGTSFVYNLANEKRRYSDSVLVIDLDIINPELTTLLGAESLMDCGIDIPFRVDIQKYLTYITSYVSTVRCGSREINFINCRSSNLMSAENRDVMMKYDFTGLLQFLGTKYQTIIVDIGNLDAPEVYQKILLATRSFKSIVCYGSTNLQLLNESTRNMHGLQGEWAVILGLAASNINHISIERQLKRRVLGVIPYTDTFYNSIQLYESTEDKILQDWWTTIAKHVRR